jgi:alanyl aminopeptidase
MMQGMRGARAVSAALLACACGAAPTTAATPWPPPPTPSAGLWTVAGDGPAGPRLGEQVAPIAYRVSLEVDPAASWFRGEATLDLSLAQASDHVWLNAERLTIESARVRLDGVDAPVTVDVVESRDLVRVGLPRSLAGAVRITIAYRGVVGDGLQGLFRESTGGRAYLYSQLEPMYARRVLPCLDEPGWKVPWDVTLVVPAGMVAAGNAPQVARTTRADGRDEVRFAPTPPMASHQLAIADGPFDVVDAGVVGRGRIPARMLVPAGKAADVAAAAAALPGVVESLESYLDRPLPLAKLDSVAVPRFFGAMENPGLVTYASGALLSERPGELPDSFRGFATHELAHQWFGNLVTMRWWDDLWISESFASWVAAEVLERGDPTGGRAGDRRALRSFTIERDLGPRARAVRQEVRTVGEAEAAFARGVYDTGPLVLATFARGLGQARFLAGLRRLLDEHAGGTIGVEELAAAIGEPRLAAGLRSFLEHTGVPRVELALDCSGAPAAVVDVRRAGTGGSAPAAGAGWQFPLCVRFPDGAAGAVGERCGWVGGASGAAHRIELGTGGCPRWLIGGDPEAYYLTSYARPLRGLLRDRLAEVPVAAHAELVAQVRADLDAGDVDVTEALAWSERLLASRDPFDVVAAVRLVRAIDGLLAPELRAAWLAWLRVHVATPARARGAGTVAVIGPSGEPAPVAAARRVLVAVIGVLGDDPATLAEGTTIVRGWLAGSPVTSGDDLALALRLAASGGDAALFAQLAARLARTTDAAKRRRLLTALAEARTPATFDVALAIASTLVGDDRLTLVGGLRLCTAGQRADAERLASEVGLRGQRLRESLSRIDDCIARRARHVVDAAAALAPVPTR